MQTDYGIANQQPCTRLVFNSPAHCEAHPISGPVTMGGPLNPACQVLLTKGDGARFQHSE
ncbi:hypothetical protein RALTA_A0826 [Cupriavidus taiwanensis LMG 19424]|uniref:Uncharacterized protein n=1 Tax=Cupriavidus taiwanensis (strain DSM 17343 / BCRC 17206 / CCUG 44338 / CIP 107171 / LMG 19424 / R1) TaxID=977880 RepID=B3R3G3_CUPTR|nr:hypothetical protein RALTA_A0826 [Cupriavidus taiwanensis LMG 19424]